MKTDTITIEKFEGESSRAYQARLEYVTAGPERSTAKIGQKLGKSKDLMDRWSSRYDWVECARKYDEQVAFLTTQDAIAAYQRDLEEYRQRYQQAGKDLYKMAQAVMSIFARTLQGQKIEGKDGRIYTIPAVELNIGTLGQVKAAFQTAADLEALALRVEHLLNDQSSTE